MVSLSNTEAINEDKSDKNTPDKNIKWLASLNEHELDFLISLGELAALRAKNIGHKDLIKKFDIKVFRALAFVLLEYLKDRIRNTLDDRSHNLLGSVSGCGLLDLNCDGNLEAVAHASMSPTRDVSFISSKRKRMWDGLQEPTTSSKKKRKSTNAAEIDMF
ncbi:hypothetical protein KSP40_PGU007268 [Platanthera guangdongensis]|uniref:Uncharacterized protein n=1 Tax=Platanthera guangdongensis TaxID=2320717 RepID=A0ABR2MLU3_9ASPA